MRHDNIARTVSPLANKIRFRECGLLWKRAHEISGSVTACDKTFTLPRTGGKASRSEFAENPNGEVGRRRRNKIVLFEEDIVKLRR